MSSGYKYKGFISTNPNLSVPPIKPNSYHKDCGTGKYLELVTYDDNTLRISFNTSLDRKHIFQTKTNNLKKTCHITVIVGDVDVIKTLVSNEFQHFDCSLVF